MLLFKCEGGSPVANAVDAHPALAGITAKTQRIALLRSDDDGQTWEEVGHYAWNRRFGGYDSLPTWH